MRNQRKRFFVLLLAPFLLACNLATLIGAGPSGVPTAASAPVAPGPAADMPALEGQVSQVVTAFLKSLQQDPAGETAQAYLTAELRQQLAAGQTPAGLVGMDGSLPDFTLSAVTFSPDAASATVDVTILYQQPVNIRFHLVQSSAAWLIARVDRHESGGSYPTSPEEVVQAFLTSYQEMPDKMSAYLSARRLAELPAGGAVGMLNIHGALEGMLIESAAVKPNPPSAAITVTIRSGGEDTSRIFSLSQEDGLWKIDNIDIP